MVRFAGELVAASKNQSEAAIGSAVSTSDFRKSFLQGAGPRDPETLGKIDAYSSQA